MSDGLKQIKLLHAITAASLVVLASGLLSGFVLGAIVPSNLPGMKRGALPNKPPTFDPADPSGNGTAQAQRDLESPKEDGNDTAAEASKTAKTAYDVTAHIGELPLDSEESYIAWMQANTQEELEYLKARWELSQRYIKSGELQGESIEAFLRTPRELFVREKNIARAYADTWLPIGYGATITDPDVVSMMTTTLAVKPNHKVLEIGTGSGYQSAILSFLTNHVYSIEIIEPLYVETNALYDALQAKYPNFGNITRKLGDGFYGWEKYGPFDRIIVTCSIDHLPPPLIKQLTPDGIMVVPLGPPGRQYIMEVKKTTDADGTIHLTRRDVYNGLSVTFIPFRNDEGQSYSNK
jgi:protein-L-isoaspartate(D-aspartate) O-methyltransferase